MTPERWRRITEISHAALARNEEARDALLDEACAGDLALRGEVDAMLAAREGAERSGQEPALAFPDEKPRLEAGGMLGPYRIEALIGAGGMGEVYRARDTRLDRTVALKVLPLELTGDAERRGRFEREARAIARLSHPHICTLYDVGRDGATDFLVMEHLEGETLAERLRRGALPLDKALDHAGQVAEALDAAHRQGIIHRDLKPGNVLLTKSGAKLLDFGLAKLRPAPRLGALDSALPTPAGPEMAAATHAGQILGTLPYMAPEQLRGEEVDARTDIFALGSVMYEMLTGQRAFQAESQANLIAAIIERDPPALTERLPVAPPLLDGVIRRCLAKDPDARWHSAADLVAVIRWISAGAATAAVTAPVRRTRSRWFVAAGVAVLSIALALLWSTRPRPPSPLTLADLSAPPGVVIRARDGFALSPDGSRLAFVAQDADGASRLWIRSLGSRHARRLAGTEGAARLFWSPDGGDIGFFADRRLKRVPAAGGAVQVLAEPTLEPKGGTWSPDGRIVYAPDYRTGLFEIPATGGEPRALTVLASDKGELSHRWPQFLPDGRALLFLVQTAEAGAADDRSRIEALEPSGARHEILKVNSSAVFAPPGQLLFWRDGAIHAQGLDPQRLRLQGEARSIADDVALTIDEWATFSVSSQGTLVYHRASALPWQLEWRERSGRLASVAAPEAQYDFPALSPDGRRVAYVTDNLTLWVRDLARGTNTRLTFDGVDHYSPAWGPGGDWLVYAANQAKEGKGGEIHRQRSSGLGPSEVLYRSQDVVHDVSWSPDGRWLAFRKGEDLHLLELETRETHVRVATPGFDWYPRFSPDGRWLAYTSNESGRDEVYVVPTVDGPEKWQVSNGGGSKPEWGRDGRELFFLGLDNVVRVASVGVGKDLQLGAAELLFPFPGASGGSLQIAPDGRLLIRTQTSRQASEGFTLVLNWPRLLD